MQLCLLFMLADLWTIVSCCCIYYNYVGPTSITGCFAGNQCGGDTIPLTSTESAAAQVRECCVSTAGLSYNLLGQCIDCVGMSSLNRHCIPLCMVIISMINDYNYCIVMHLYSELPFQKRICILCSGMHEIQFESLFLRFLKLWLLATTPQQFI